MASQRQQIRKAIKVWLLGSISGWKAAYAYEPKDLSELSPVVTVHSDGTSPYSDRDQNLYAFVVSIWVKRVGDGDTTEDRIDDLSEQVIDLLMSGGTGILSSIRVDEAYSAVNFSSMDYPSLSDTNGVQYRRERIRVIV